jgi:hypothetical protein
MYLKELESEVSHFAIRNLERREVLLTLTARPMG